MSKCDNCTFKKHLAQMFDIHFMGYQDCPKKCEEVKNMKFRKKPVEVDAIRWDGLNVSEIEEFCEGKARIEYYDAAWKASAFGVVADIFIDTLEGTHHASVGDYIIKGIHGEFYPCKPLIFAKTYLHEDGSPLRPEEYEV